jgi:Domain of unknown function (DUF4290)
MQYNTTRNHLIMKEYGRHIQRMVEYLLTIEDKEIRQRNAYTTIELMGFLNPHLKNVEDFRHKLWDHLFLISDFKLEVESPYPIPTRETLKAKPDPLPYPKRYPRYNHLGKNIEVIIDKALNETDQDKRQGFANSIAYYMKLVYSNWHKELMHDDNIQSELSNITKGQLEFNNRPYVKHKVEIVNDDYPPARGRRTYVQRNTTSRNEGSNRGGGNRDGNRADSRNDNRNDNRGGNRDGNRNDNRGGGNRDGNRADSRNDNRGGGNRDNNRGGGSYGKKRY